jgi:hypothetical protein
MVSSRIDFKRGSKFSCIVIQRHLVKKKSIVRQLHPRTGLDEVVARTNKYQNHDEWNCTGNAQGQNECIAIADSVQNNVSTYLLIQLVRASKNKTFKRRPDQHGTRTRSLVLTCNRAVGGTRATIAPTSRDF